jgi:hypothetical protein
MLFARHKPILSLVLLALVTAPMRAAVIAVRYTQGTEHGYLLVRSEGGVAIGHGDLIQTAHGTRVTTQLVLHFNDGSIDDETAVYSQGGVFRLISDHHIQHGPYFAKPLDMTVEADGEVTSRTAGSDGKMQVAREHLDLPPDISNGMLSAIVTNIPANSNGITAGMVVPVGTGRLIKLDITQDKPEQFHITGLSYTAHVFRIHLNLGGVLGVVAPLLGKQPGDLFIWVSERPAPQLLRLEGPLASGGRVVSVELCGMSFEQATVH